MRATLILLVSAIVVVVAAVAVREVLVLKEVHSTFENYYAFRGGTQRWSGRRPTA